MTAFDHFIYGGADLDAMRADFAGFTGVEPSVGGCHPGMGTRNALASLDGGVYLELLAPDPQQPQQANMGARVGAFARSQLFAYMLKAAGGELEAAQAVLERGGIASDLIDASRATPDGATLRWRLLVPRANPFGDHLPKFIDWLHTPHPSTSAARGCGFEAFELGHPRADELAALLRELGVPLPVHAADRPYQLLRIRTPRGARVLTSQG